MGMGRTWTPEDVEELKRLYTKGESIGNIAEKLGRSKNGIESKLRKTGLMVSKNAGMTNNSGKKWTDEAIEELMQLAEQGLSADEIAEKMERSRDSIVVKINRLGKQILKPNRMWTDEDKEQLKIDWVDPELSKSRLCKKYKRPWYGIVKQSQVMKLGPRPYNDQYLSMPTICEEMQVSVDRVENWIKLGLPRKKNRSGKVKWLIDVDDLLKFLETHQDYFDASKVSQYLFYEEPKWLIEKRKADIYIHQEKRRLPYTNEEDKTIELMFKRGKSDKEIAEKLHRTQTGIFNRRIILGLTKNNYSEEEIEILKKYGRYETVYELQRRLPLRKIRGIITKCEQLGIPYHTSKNRCEKMKD